MSTHTLFLLYSTFCCFLQWRASTGSVHWEGGSNQSSCHAHSELGQTPPGLEKLAKAEVVSSTGSTTARNRTNSAAPWVGPQRIRCAYCMWCCSQAPTDWLLLVVVQPSLSITMCCICYLQSLPVRIPPGRNYTVVGSLKVMFPQWRVMKSDFPGRLVWEVVEWGTQLEWNLKQLFDTFPVGIKYVAPPPPPPPPLPFVESSAGPPLLTAGQAVFVKGRSPQRGFLLVDNCGQQLLIPHYYTELRVRTGQPITPTSCVHVHTVLTYRLSSLLCFVHSCKGALSALYGVALPSTVNVPSLFQSLIFSSTSNPPCSPLSPTRPAPSPSNPPCSLSLQPPSCSLFVLCTLPISLCLFSHCSYLSQLPPPLAMEQEWAAKLVIFDLWGRTQPTLQTQKHYLSQKFYQ